MSPLVDQKQKHYINNEDFLKALVAYKESCIEAEKNGKSKPNIPNYIGECWMKIAEGLSHKPNFINYIFMQENPGFRILHDAMKDALILKEGVLTWYKQDKETVEEYSYSGLSQEEAALIAQDPQVTVLELQEEQIFTAQTNVVTMSPDMNMTPRVFSMRVKRVIREPRYIVECIPVEQFLIDNQATSIDDALIAGRRKLATVSELVAMGYDKDIVEMNAGSGGFELNMETLVRNPADQSFFGVANGNDESTDKVYYVEAYIRIDKDGDGIAELHNHLVLEHVLL